MEVQWSNSRNSVRFDLATDSASAVFKNHVGTYQLKQIHFHWGPTSRLGSEHMINRRTQTYGGELYFVTRKTTGCSIQLENIDEM